MRTKNSPNDPGRRQRIVDTTMRLIQDEGVGAVTARAVAAKADVPVGSVSYYFPSVHALLTEGSRQLLQSRAGTLKAWEVGVTSDNLEERLAQLIHEQLTSGRSLTVAAYELYIHGLRDPEMRRLSVDLVAMLQETIANYRPVDEAARLAALFDGYQMQSLFAPVPPDVRTVERFLSGQ